MTCLNMLLSCFRKRMSDLRPVAFAARPVGGTLDSALLILAKPVKTRYDHHSHMT